MAGKGGTLDEVAPHALALPLQTSKVVFFAPPKASTSLSSQGRTLPSSGPVQLAMPEPQDGELKIRVKACGLNFIDLMVRQGNIDNPPKTPLVPGFECSGIVEALGDSVKGYEIGDRVMAFVNYNAWAEVVCTPVEFVYKIPDDMSFSEAAAFPMNFVTAL